MHLVYSFRPFPPHSCCYLPVPFPSFLPIWFPLPLASTFGCVVDQPHDLLCKKAEVRRSTWTTSQQQQAPYIFPPFSPFSPFSPSHPLTLFPIPFLLFFFFFTILDLPLSLGDHKAQGGHIPRENPPFSPKSRGCAGGFHCQPGHNFCFPRWECEADRRAT